jgi:hypothetical protein
MPSISERKSTASLTGRTYQLSLVGRPRGEPRVDAVAGGIAVAFALQQPLDVAGMHAEIDAARDAKGRRARLGGGAEERHEHAAHHRAAEEHGAGIVAREGRLDDELRELGWQRTVEYHAHDLQVGRAGDQDDGLAEARVGQARLRHEQNASARRGVLRPGIDRQERAEQKSGPALHAPIIGQPRPRRSFAGARRRAA